MVLRSVARVLVAVASVYVDRVYGSYDLVLKKELRGLSRASGLIATRSQNSFTCLRIRKSSGIARKSAKYHVLNVTRSYNWSGSVTNYYDIDKHFSVVRAYINVCRDITKKKVTQMPGLLTIGIRNYISIRNIIQLQNI